MSWFEFCGGVAMVIMCVLLLTEVRTRHVGQLYTIENGKWMAVNVDWNKR